VVGRLPSGDTVLLRGSSAGVTVSHDDEPRTPPPEFAHVPVLLDRVVELFRDVPPGLYVDATLGGGGHAAAVLAANPGLRLLGLDRDDVAIEAASRRLAPFGDRVEIVRTGFDRLADVVRERTDEGASAVLMDLGVSSPQLDVAERGFSYRAAAPLDMRMDRRQSSSALDVVNGYSYPELVRVIREFGEERFASRVARAIVEARPVADTEQLAEIVRDAIPAPARRTGGHPAKRTFQAIRIEVNRELDQLADALDGALSVLAPGGRLAVMSYHSLEDRMVKSTLREAETGGCVCPPGLPCACGAEPTVRLLKRGAWTASADEVATNRRAESVRLRAVERLSEQAS
jgi:16S rRNA (cytosine1402-N4)-methyltransferase